MLSAIISLRLNIVLTSNRQPMTASPNKRNRIGLLLTFLLCCFPVGHDYMIIPLLILEPLLLFAVVKFSHGQLLAMIILIGQILLLLGIFLKPPFLKNVLSLISLVIFVSCAVSFAVILHKSELQFMFISCLPFLFFAWRFIASLFIKRVNLIR